MREPSTRLVVGTIPAQSRAAFRAAGIEQGDEIHVHGALESASAVEHHRVRVVTPDVVEMLRASGALRVPSF